MKDSQPRPQHLHTAAKYIKESNERFSTAKKMHRGLNLSISRRVMKDSQPNAVPTVSSTKYIKESNERFSTVPFGGGYAS